MDEGIKMNETKKRILVVDDDANILRGFKGILEKEGYVVEAAETGKDALEKIENEKFNVCLIDVRLPDMDGTEILRKMANDSETIKIIVTGFSSDEVGKKAADYGADEFLVKPVSAEELIATVRDRLGTIQHER
jgi:DNA-binding response OmpR family regulator